MFFTEGVFYQYWASTGRMLDITQYVNEKLTEFGEDKSIADKMDASIPRLGMYSNFKSQTPIADYLYLQEAEGQTLAYDGHLNRSRAFYEMNISSYIQNLVNELLDMEPKADGTLDFDSMTMPRTIYIAPDVYDLFTFKRTILQGADTKINPASIELELTYTLVK